MKLLAYLQAAYLRRLIGQRIAAGLARSGQACVWYWKGASSLTGRNMLGRTFKVLSRHVILVNVRLYQ
jgi:hypothetical protein